MNSRGFLLIVAGAALLSTSAIVIEVAGVGPSTSATLRCALAVLMLAPFAVQEWGRRTLSSRGVRWSLIGGLALGVDYTLWTASIFHVGAGIATVLVNVQVIIVPLLAVALDREPLARHFRISAPTLMIGVALIGLAGAQQLAFIGTLEGLAAGFGFAVYLFMSRRVSRTERGTAVQSLTWATIGATVSAAVLSPFSEGLQFGSLTGAQWGYMIILAATGQTVSWLLIHRGGALLDPATAAGTLMLQPVLTLALSAMLLAQYPNALQLLGVLVVLAAIAWANGVWRRAVTAYRGSRTRAIQQQRRGTNGRQAGSGSAHGRTPVGAGNHGPDGW